MPSLIPSRTPLTPEQAERGSDHLLALQMGGSASVAGRAEVDPELAFILPRLAQEIVWATTTLDAQADPRADSFAPRTRSDACCCPRCTTGRGTPPPRRRWASPAASSGSR
ncbi:hypothetical protein AB0945_13505 [Streptomyces sp. NPDC005474]|uniref:hypothetical protein n=1 Tax=Streptomyces sp. NPDC005474 TaxID=3154878 RepID=UPI00345259C4